MVLEASDALTQIVILVGVVIGNVVGATALPYIKAKSKYEDFDINILFKKEFLMTCAGTAITTFIAISGIFTTLINQVLATNPVTYLAAFSAALGIGFTLNTAINAVLPQPTNKEAAKELEEKKALAVMKLKGIDAEKLQNMMNEEDNTGAS